MEEYEKIVAEAQELAAENQRKIDILLADMTRQELRNCHADCEKYAAFRAEIDKQREYNKQFQFIDPMPHSHEMEKKNRRKKYKGGKQ